MAVVARTAIIRGPRRAVVRHVAAAGVSGRGCRRPLARTSPLRDDDGWPTNARWPLDTVALPLLDWRPCIPGKRFEMDPTPRCCLRWGPARHVVLIRSSRAVGGTRVALAVVIVAALGLSACGSSSSGGAGGSAATGSLAAAGAVREAAPGRHAHAGRHDHLSAS